MNELLNQAFDSHKQGQLGEAEKLYKELLTQSPDNIQVLDLLARIKISQKKYQEGITINKKILRRLLLSKFIFRRNKRKPRNK